VIRTLCGLFVVLALSGCYYGPGPYYPYGYPATAPGPSAYDRSWNAAVGAIRDQGVNITREDRTTGTIEGQRGGMSVNARVVTQADGRVRVEFNTGGNLAEDPGLSDRVSRSYDARMGR
jgi:hypothetical protein